MLVGIDGSVPVVIECSVSVGNEGTVPLGIKCSVRIGI